jgi:Xaa-Pro aminopeptidase
MGEIFEAAMDVWHDAGYTDVRRHHVGHSIGLTPHERPMIAPGSRETAEPGMVLAVEVPCYVLGLGGFVPEDIIEVVPGGFDRYSYAPTELPVV